MLLLINLLSRIKLVNSVAAGIGPIIGQYIINNFVIIYYSCQVFCFYSHTYVYVHKNIPIIHNMNISKNPLLKIITKKWFILSCLSGSLHLFLKLRYTHI